jgi:hypothetical protein
MSGENYQNGYIVALEHKMNAKLPDIQFCFKSLEIINLTDVNLYSYFVISPFFIVVCYIQDVYYFYLYYMVEVEKSQLPSRIVTNSVLCNIY